MKKYTKKYIEQLEKDWLYSNSDKSNKAWKRLLKQVNR
jgi:replication initiation and membrane attachment protein DnaB